MSVKIQMQDNFDDNSIDTSKWDESDAGGQISESSQTLRLANPHSGTIAEFANTLKSDISITSGIITVQCDLTWTTDSANEAIGGIYLYVDNNNWASITSRAAGGNLRIRVQDGGSSVYSFESSISKNKTVKIEYDISTKDIKFYYWNVNTWTQIGTTQNYDIGSTCYLVFTSGDAAGFTGANPIIIDNAYLVSGSYTVNPPVNVSGAGSLYYQQI